MLDFDAGDEEDEELMKFLQVRGGEEEEREREREGSYSRAWYAALPTLI